MKRRNRCLDPNARSDASLAVEEGIRKQFVAQDEAVDAIVRSVTS
jgi:hypothetical protein